MNMATSFFPQINSQLPHQKRLEEFVLPDLLHWKMQGQNAALVTLAKIDGSSPRPIGAQMAVSENGQVAGHIAQECLDQALITQARETIQNRCNRLIRYGKDSTYLDIRLPCGSGIDIYFDVNITKKLLQKMQKIHERRQPFILETRLDNGHSQIIMEEVFPQNGENKNGLCYINPDKDSYSLFRSYQPDLQLYIIGAGLNCVQLGIISKLSGFQPVIFSPEKATRKHANEAHLTHHDISSLSDTHHAAPDPYTAAVLLFHDHDREIAVLKKLLASDCFYIGTMGSRKTHARRLAALSLSLSPPHLNTDRISAPVGLTVKSDNPQELAISILAEILQKAKIAGLLP